MIESNHVIFRLAAPGDVNQLADLRWRLQTDDAAEFDNAERTRFIVAFTESVSASFHDGPFFHWIAETNGHVVAVVSVGKVVKVLSPKSLERHWGYLTNCYTLPDYRGRGIGTKLLAAITEWLKPRDMNSWLSGRVTKAIHFMSGAGFTGTADPLILKLDDQD